MANIILRKSLNEGSIKLSDGGKMAVSYSANSECITSIIDDGENGVEAETETGFSGEEDTVSLIPSEMDKDGVVREYEVALKHLGFGFFHILLQVINGVALSSDAVEVLSISFLLPVLARKDEWAATSTDEAVLGSIIFLGMLFGSFVWGGLADMIGRRTAIVLSLLTSAFFGFFSAFLPWFWMFVAFRFLSGFG